MSPITREMLRAYICDALPDAELAAVERSLRESSELRALLKEVIEQDLPFERAPELFCFGLLERFDVPQLSALVAPRPIHNSGASELVPVAR